MILLVARDSRSVIMLDKFLVISWLEPSAAVFHTHLVGIGGWGGGRGGAAAAGPEFPTVKLQRGVFPFRFLSEIVS